MYSSHLVNERVHGPGLLDAGLKHGLEPHGEPLLLFCHAPALGEIRLKDLVECRDLVAGQVELALHLR